MYKNDTDKEDKHQNHPIVKCPYCSHEGDDFKKANGFRVAYLCPNCDSWFYDFMGIKQDNGGDQ